MRMILCALSICLPARCLSAAQGWVKWGAGGKRDLFAGAGESVLRLERYR
jgi:hypothetical protein